MSNRNRPSPGIGSGGANNTARLRRAAQAGSMPELQLGKGLIFDRHGRIAVDFEGISGDIAGPRGSQGATGPQGPPGLTGVDVAQRYEIAIATLLAPATDPATELAGFPTKNTLDWAEQYSTRRDWSETFETNSVSTGLVPVSRHGEDTSILVFQSGYYLCMFTSIIHSHGTGDSSYAVAFSEVDSFGEDATYTNTLWRTGESGPGSHGVSGDFVRFEEAEGHDDAMYPSAQFLLHAQGLTHVRCSTAVYDDEEIANYLQGRLTCLRIAQWPEG